MDDNLADRVRRRARRRAPAPQAIPASADQRRGLLLPEGWLFGLLLPCDEDRPCTLVVAQDSAAGISRALGGVLLDACAVDGLPTHRCWVYLDSDRHDRRLPRNRRLDRLASTLGWPRDRSGDWRGSALITGRDLHWSDRDVPSVVLAATLPAEPSRPPHG
jgi:hypothetical protein